MGFQISHRALEISRESTATLLVVAVSAASVQDRQAGPALIWAVRAFCHKVTMTWADSGYSGALVHYAATLGVHLQIVAKLASQVGFHVLPRRWVVERTLSWISRCRRTVRDYERLPEHHAAIVQWSMIIIMTRRLADHHQT